MGSVQLQSQDHRTLLDIVDKIRLLGISQYISLPQIVVCGDQSAGKSSVLEAISGIRFPTKDNLCTRFATELILRRSETISVSVSITPVDRDEEDSSRLSNFTYDVDSEDLDLSGAIEAAKIAMGISTTKVFSSDRLRIELQGPNQPHLTLVDLPGLFRAGNREQSIDEAPVVRKMVRSYMSESRSIILAVVSAKVDYALQEVTQFAQELDGDGSRTLGLITKPDTLSVGSDSEAAYLTLAQNKDVHFRLGWHVLRNRDYETRHVSSEERDQQETLFFRTGKWASLNPSIVGIRGLKTRLSDILKDQILRNLPGLLVDCKLAIKQCEDVSNELGDSRHTLADQKRYLQRTSWRFSVLMKAAVDGVYNDPFFGSAKTEDGYRKRLRAVVQNSLEDFAEEVRTKGHALMIVEDGHEHSENDEVNTVFRSKYVASVKELMRRSRGAELPGTFNPLIIGELFREQCQPWYALVVRVRDIIFQCVRWTAGKIIGHVATQDTVQALASVINQAIDVLAHDVDAAIAKILRPYLEGHPITYNHYLISNVQKIQDDRQQRAFEAAIKAAIVTQTFSANVNVFPKELIKCLKREEEIDMATHASQLAVDYMEAYYKVAMKTCVDDISIHAIEEQLIRKLTPIFDAEALEHLSDAKITTLAAEKESSALERAHNQEKLASFRQALQELQSLDVRNFRTDNVLNNLIDADEAAVTTQAMATHEPDDIRSPRLMSRSSANHSATATAKPGPETGHEISDFPEIHDASSVVENEPEAEAVAVPVSSPVVDDDWLAARWEASAGKKYKKKLGRI